MFRKLLFSLLFVSAAAAAAAQPLKVEWGVMAGINVPDYKTDMEVADIKNKLGWQAGIVTSLKIGWVSVDPQIFYVRQGLRIRPEGGGELNLKSNSIDVPVLVSFRPVRFVRIFAGPVFTATEETGMDGAFGLKAGLLQGDILLNLDSETEGELYVGCAGGMDANMTFDYAAAAVPAGDYKAVRLTVKGLKGGHSGIQIVAQRANANKLLFRLLNAEAAKRGLLLASVDGGGLRNAIPREAEAVVLLPAAEYAAFAEAVKSYEKTVVAEFAGIEDSVSVRAELCDAPAAIIPADVASKLIRAVAGCPDGVVRMSAAMPGLVQTSSNLARVVSDGTTVRLQALLRSSVRSEKEALGEAIAAVFALAGARTELTGSYDGWNPDMSSPILKAMTASYEQLYGRKPAVTAIHAGLECGIIGSNYPGLDMISFGPTICYPHSPDEKVEIASVGKFYDFLVRTLANVPQK